MGQRSDAKKPELEACVFLYDQPGTDYTVTDPLLLPCACVHHGDILSRSAPCSDNEWDERATSALVPSAANRQIQQYHSAQLSLRLHAYPSEKTQHSKGATYGGSSGQTCQVLEQRRQNDIKMHQMPIITMFIFTFHARITL